MIGGLLKSMGNKYTLAVFFQPFVVEQKIVLYKNGNIENQFTSSIDEVIDKVNGLVNTYDVTDIKLYGSLDYLNGFEQKMNTKFSYKNVTVTKGHR
jgi:hypothetical protein